MKYGLIRHAYMHSTHLPQFLIQIINDYVSLMCCFHYVKKKVFLYRELLVLRESMKKTF